MEMNPRERILAAIRHEPLDRFATDIWATPEVWDKLADYFGATDREMVFDRVGIDGIIDIEPAYIGGQGQTHRSAPTDAPIFYDEWGMGFRKQVYAGGAYDEQVVFPLAEAENITDLEAYAWPTPEMYDYSIIPETARRYPQRAISSGYTAVFFWHNRLRGLELSLRDPLERPEFTHYLIQRLSDFFSEYHRRCFEAGKGLIDMTQVTDDFGSQHSLLISPRLFDQFYCPAMQRAIDLAKSYGLYVFHHDDGDVRPLLPRLVELGIDILNPVQWRCGGWDLDELKNRYGKRFCFHGGVDNQQTLPFGTTEQVRAEVRWLAHTLGRDRTGWIIAPCHNLQAITPVENILAMYDEAQRL